MPSLVMRSYRERELPLRVISATEDSATFRIPGQKTTEVGVGESIDGTNLKVIQVQRKMRGGKESRGEPTEVSVVEVEDKSSGRTQELTVALPALAHDPVALVEDGVTGKLYVARTGQRFKSADGRDYLVADVRPNQVVLEAMETGETATIRLLGPKG